MLNRCKPLLQTPIRSVHKYQPVLNSLSHNVTESVYAVRGQIPMRGAEIQTDIKKGKLYDGFKETTALNIGNPQQVGQGCITFNREVISGFMHEPLLETTAISEDAKRRVLEFKKGCNSPIGAYTQNSKGWTHVRNAVAKYIEERDNIPADPENIYLTNGASEGVRTAFQTLIRNPHDGILVPIP